MIVVHFLQHHPGCTFSELQSPLCDQFPGLMTPSMALIRVVLDSYGIEEDGRWRLRPEDSPDSRRADLCAMRPLLESLGSRLGYAVISAEGRHHPLLWQEKGRTIYAFYVQASALAARILRQNPYPPERSFLVLPGGRAGLLAYKLRRDPSLEQIMASGWRVLKFRHLRRLADMPSLTREKWKSVLTGDPIEPPEQMRLF